jgi:uncharacterized membrane protein
LEQQASRPQVTGWKRDVVIWLDSRIYGLAKHWLALFNALLGFYVLLPLLAPMVMSGGALQAGRLIYAVYKPACHQLPERSFFLSGPRSTYALDELQSLGVLSEDDDIFSRQRFMGAPGIGYKMALCQRDMALYGGMFVAGLLFGLVRKRLRPLKLWVFGLCLLPMAVDGVTQLLLFRESTWPLRVLTGGLVGVASVWLLYPHLEGAFADICRQANDRVHIEPPGSQE